MNAPALKRRSPARRKPLKIASPAKKANGPSWLNEAVSVLFFGAALFLLTSFLAVELQMGKGAEHPLGPVGFASGRLLWDFFGWSALVAVAYLTGFGVYFWNNELGDGEKSSSFSIRAASKIFGCAGILLFAPALLVGFFGADAGGRLGNLLAAPLLGSFNVVGASLILSALLLVALALATGQSVQAVVVTVINTFLVTAQWIFINIPMLCWEAICLIGNGVGAVLRWVLGARMAEKLGAFFRASNEVPELRPLPKPRLHRNFISRALWGDSERVVERPSRRSSEKSESKADSKSDTATAKRKGRDEEISSSGDTEDTSIEHSSEADDTAEEGDEQSQVLVLRREISVKKPGKDSVTVVPPTPAFTDINDAFPDYQPPPLSLLTKGEPTVGSEDDEELLAKSRQIEMKLKDFGVFGRVTQVHPGPVITLFEFEPAPGVKVQRIAALQDDLSMSLKASSIRIIAPIPKRGTVGIEVPNRTRELVRLRDVLESDGFTQAKSILTIGIGKDTYGEPVSVDIASMPHLLMAGSTGTGKSMSLNSILLSLLYRCHPSELGLILIDPKVLELSMFEDIPHLRVPVVTVPKQARAVLDWAVQEMERRYRLMKRFGVRNIDGYNRIARGEEDPEEVLREEQHRAEQEAEAAANGEGVEALSLAEQVEGALSSPLANSTSGDAGLAAPISAEAELDAPPIAGERLRPLPKIVIVIDELADLMMTVGKDVEELITRLAQKARASGIHLIVATQRPSVDVITGLIKANFPARLSFRVSSRIDSRTILDSMGSEKLLGMGDMLLMLPGADSIKRVHGSYVHDMEAKRVVEAIKKTAKPCYDERIMQLCQKALEEKDGNGTAGETTDADYDPMYDQAVELVMAKGQASTSMIQRAFRLGYNRAARIVEQMERDGLVGPADGAKPREVLSRMDPNSGELPEDVGGGER